MVDEGRPCKHMSMHQFRAIVARCWRGVVCSKPRGFVTKMGDGGVIGGARLLREIEGQAGDGAAYA